MSAKKKLQVFVSSTYKDLMVERQAAVEAILKAGHIPAGMELFSAGSESQLQTIRRWIDESDVYMLILGGRYGSVDPKTSLSYTELEYDYAVSQDKPVFAVAITEAALDAKIRAEGKDVVETDNPKELKLFREKVLTRISSFFSDPKDIKLAAHETLADIQARYALAGWVSASDLPDVSSMLEEMKRLRAERDEAASQLAQLKAKTEKQAARPSSRWSDDEFKELGSLLNKLEINTKVFNEMETDPPLKLNVLKILDVMRDNLITGVTNRANVSDHESLLFHNICPKLEMHELAAVEKVSGMAWQRYRLTAKGKALLIYLDKRKHAVAQISDKQSSVPDCPPPIKADTAPHSSTPTRRLRKKAEV
ncbi:DUF4062 domain-containing protein [Caballeronia sp. LjRoot31]|uniref:DUF4062 domain-containing protein n=1 Tax=Caballeronia sp. LjRoot31 TaxID=3342324 RepID=UPI003ECF63AA